MNQRISGWRAFLFTALAAALILAAYFQTMRPAPRPYDPASTGRSGLRALVLWLEALGHPVQLGIPAAHATPGPGLMFVFPPTPGLSAAGNSFLASDDAAQIAAWTDAGGTLVLIGPPQLSEIFQRFEIYQVSADVALDDPRQAQPLLPDLPAKFSDISLRYRLDAEVTSPWTHVVIDGNNAPVVTLRPWGQGLIWAMTEDFAFTNANLRSDPIARLLPALLRTVPPGAPIIISLDHLQSASGAADTTVNTLQDWLYTTPLGQAVTITTIILVLFLILQGRRLGPPIPTISANRPRAAAEYVVAIAGLQRRARQRRDLAQHHAQRLKLVIGRAIQLDATLPDEDWLTQLRRRAPLPASTLAEVEQLLLAYRQADDDAEFIRLVQATDALLASLPRTANPLVR